MTTDESDLIDLQAYISSYYDGNVKLSHIARTCSSWEK